MTESARIITVNLLVEVDGYHDACLGLLTENMRKYVGANSGLIDWKWVHDSPVELPDDYTPDDSPFPEHADIKQGIKS